MARKIQVTFSNGQWKLTEKLRGTIRDTDSEIVRNIVKDDAREKKRLDFYRHCFHQYIN